MILISHRGNITGPNPQQENRPEYVEAALEAGYKVEIDVWHSNDHYHLGHDRPQYEVTESFLDNPKLWCHAKDPHTFELLLNSAYICFWHTDEDYVLTSHGYIWAYPGKFDIKKAIVVLPDLSYNVYGFLGVCSDYIGEYSR